MDCWYGGIWSCGAVVYGLMTVNESVSSNSEEGDLVDIMWQFFFHRLLVIEKEEKRKIKCGPNRPTLKRRTKINVDQIGRH